MDSGDLTDRQVRRLVADVGGMLTYLNNLCGRMQQLRFPDGDPLDREAHAARVAMQRLFDVARSSGRPAPKPLRDE